MPAPRRRLPLQAMGAQDALDRAEALLASAGEGPALAWSRVERPALVVGRSAGGSGVDEAACRAAGVPVVHRRSGGGPVLWDADLLALDIVLPRGHPLAADDVVAAYAWLGEAVAGALRGLGLPARSVRIAEARVAERHPLAAGACFGALSPYEVVAGERKVVGLAQVRRRTGALFQAGIPLRLDAEGLAGLLDLGDERAAFADALRARATGLRELDAGLTGADVVAAVEAALARLGERTPSVTGTGVGL